MEARLLKSDLEDILQCKINQLQLIENEYRKLTEIDNEEVTMIENENGRITIEYPESGHQSKIDECQNNEIEVKSQISLLRYLINECNYAS